MTITQTLKETIQTIANSNVFDAIKMLDLAHDVLNECEDFVQNGGGILTIEDNIYHTVLNIIVNGDPISIPFEDYNDIAKKALTQAAKLCS